MMTDSSIKHQLADGRFCWSWRGWMSSAHEYLEERHWTPLIISDQLCFSARDGQGWRVVWGDCVGRVYDDVYDTIDYQGAPLYIARVDCDWFLVWNATESQRFAHQITFGTEEAGLFICRFAWRVAEAERVEPIWRRASDSGDENMEGVKFLERDAG